MGRSFKRMYLLREIKNYGKKFNFDLLFLYLVVTLSYEI